MDDVDVEVEDVEEPLELPDEALVAVSFDVPDELEESVEPPEPSPDEPDVEPELVEEDLPEPRESVR